MKKVCPFCNGDIFLEVNLPFLLLKMQCVHLKVALVHCNNFLLLPITVWITNLLGPTWNCSTGEYNVPQTFSTENLILAQLNIERTSDVAT